MGILNVFSDPKLRARQDQLNAQWNSLWAVYQTCDNTPDSAFAEFATDLRLWRTFYDSESDWSSSSTNATNEWQAKAKEWTGKLNEWGCNGNYDAGEGPNGIPGVKTPPPDETSIFQDARDAVNDKVDDFFGSLATIGWVATGLAVLVLVGIVYLLTHAKASTPYGSIGK